jgi:hypothetical protein
MKSESAGGQDSGTATVLRFTGTEPLAVRPDPSHRDWHASLSDSTSSAIMPVIPWQVADPGAGVTPCSQHGVTPCSRHGKLMFKRPVAHNRWLVTDSED